MKILRVVFPLFFFTFLAPAATADFTTSEAIVADLARDHIKVDVNFSGARITLFAATPAADNNSVAFAVALVGPHRKYAVSRAGDKKSERFEFASAPSVLSVAAEPAVQHLTTPTALLGMDKTPAFAAIPLPEGVDDPNLGLWRKALSDLKTERGMYKTDSKAIKRVGEGLIRADIDLPAAAPPGAYEARIYMFNGEVATAEGRTTLILERQGAEHALFGLSHDYPILYGIVAVLIGCAIGLIGSAIRAED